MPRRPSKKSKSAGKPRNTNRPDAKINKWNDRSDIPMDEEDQFHASRDQILLNNEEEEDDGDIDDDEVFALQMEDEEDEEDEESEAMEENENQSSRASPKAAKSKQKATAKGKGKGKETQLESSDDDDEEEEETWGSGKAAYYSSNAAQIESDDEEALQLEEQEAKRLQAKARDDMNDEDFGLEDSIEANVTGGSDHLDAASVPVQPVLQDKPSILRHLQKTDPECLALAGDWTDSATTLMKTKQKLEKLEAEGGSKNSISLGMMHLHYQTLLTYTTTLAFYLYLRASRKYAQKPELLRSHPVMQRLLKLKQSLITLEDLNFAVSDDDDSGDEEEEEENEEDDIMQDARQLWEREHSNEDEDEDVDSDELDQLLADARSITNSNSNRVIIQPKAPALTHPPKKKRKTDSESEKSSLSMFDLVEPEFVSSKTTSSTSPYAAADAFGEATSLQHADATDKSARRKTLRFHTSRIESANARRSNARSNALGGDDDIPYRERKKDREDRLAREAAARVRTQGGADLDDTEPEPRRPDDNDGDGDEEMEDANGYYDLVKKQVKEKKERKKAEYEASRADRFVEEASNGPRSLTRAILANKGLTPHRPKCVRNPRVKKKINFAKAQRKVASQKAVYKGGVNATGGRYEGEKSGISKVVKSVRLG